MYSFVIHPDRRHALEKLDRRWKTRLNIRLSSIFLTLLSIIAFAASIPTWQSTFFHASGPIRGDWTDGLALIPLSLILFVDVLIIRRTILLCHGPKPFVVATIEFIVLTLLTPALAIAVLGSLFVHFSAAVPETTGAITCSALQNMLSQECSPMLYTVGSLQLLGVVFGCLVWILHISMAIWGALDVRRNRQRTSLESSLEGRRRKWREERGERTGRSTRRGDEEAGQKGTDRGAYETYGWYR